MIVRCLPTAFCIILLLSCSNEKMKKVDSEEHGIATASTQIQDVQSTYSQFIIPDGFTLSVYAEDVPDARSLSLAPDGTLFVGNREGDKVFALQDRDGDFKVDKKFVIANRLKMPNGVAFKDGDLYVAEVNRILRFHDVLENLSDKMAYEVLYDGYPNDRHHGWKYIAFGPDGKLYVPVGAPCNICLSENKMYASITRLDLTSLELEMVHHGIRNTVGFNWHPTTGDLWFTDNGRDWLGDDIPADELNHATRDGMHFGYPYCHQGDLPDPEIVLENACATFSKPAAKLGAHVAALGIEFYQAGQFPVDYENSIFIAEHGSWNRSTPSGYRISRVVLDGDRVVSYEPFIAGFRPTKEEVLARPVDLEWLPDGSLLMSDDHGGKIYRISYSAPVDD